MGLVLLLTYVAVTHDSDHDPRHPDRPMVLGQQMREVSNPLSIGSQLTVQCYRTSFSTDSKTVLGSTYQFIGFVALIDIAPSLLAVIYATFERNERDFHDLNVYCKFTQACVRPRGRADVSDRLSHPVLLLLLLLGVSRKELMRRWSGLRQILIDAEYVLEERVENYNPDRKKKVKFGDGVKTFDGSSDEDDGEVWEDVEVENDDNGDNE